MHTLLVAHNIFDICRLCTDISSFISDTGYLSSLCIYSLFSTIVGVGLVYKLVISKDQLLFLLICVSFFFNFTCCCFYLFICVFLFSFSCFFYNFLLWMFSSMPFSFPFSLIHVFRNINFPLKILTMHLINFC